MEQALEQPRLAHNPPPSPQEAWDFVLDQLRPAMNRSDYEARVTALKPLGCAEGVFRLGAVNSYTRDWCKSRLGATIANTLEMIYGHRVTVRFTLQHEMGSPSDAPLDITRLPVSPAEPGGGEGAADPTALQNTPQVETAPKNGSSKIDSPTIGAVSAAVKEDEVKPQAKTEREENASPRKIRLQRAYGTERARVIQPERGMFITQYFFNKWLPLLGQSAFTTILAARSLCYWNPLNGELRNVVDTEMADIAQRASVSVRTVKDVLNNELVKKYFLRYRVRRIMTANGVRTAGITIQVRMDDPLTPEDQHEHQIAESERWYTAEFEDERED